MSSSSPRGRSEFREPIRRSLSVSPPPVSVHLPNGGEHALDFWSIQSRMAASEHFNDAEHFHNQYKRTTMPVIVLSAVAVLLSTFSTGNMVQSDTDTGTLVLQVFIALINCAIGILTGILSTFDYKTRSTLHQIAAVRFSSIARDVTIQTHLPDDERDKVLVERIGMRYTDALTNAPLLRVTDKRMADGIFVDII